MEAAIRGVIKDMMEDYVYGLDKADMSQFPIVFRNLKLRPPKINEILEEDTPFQMESGSIGMVKIDPGWSGAIDVEASGIKLALNFSPMKAAQLAMKPADPDINADEIFMTGAHAPPAARGPPIPMNVAPRFCEKHDSSEKRKKTDPHPCTCKSCGLVFTSSYAEVALCSGCSDKEKRCLVCGAPAQKACSYIPPNAVSNGNANRGQQPRENRDSMGRMSFGGANPSAYGTRLDLPNKGGSMEVLTPRELPSAQKQIPMQKAAPPRRPPPPQARRQRVEEDDDDDPIAGFLKAINCAAFGNFDERESEFTEPIQRNGIPRR
jgi:hypothetical protein